MLPRQLALDLLLLPLRTDTLPPATHTNVYAIGSSQLLIVDPAPQDPAEQTTLLLWLRELQSQNRQIKAALLTHHHPDHVGAAALLVSELKIPLWAHELTAQRLPRLAFDHLVCDNETIHLGNHTWIALHTPGHAPGHLCLYNRQSQVLLLGDMIASCSTILISPQDGDMSEYIFQLERLENLHAHLGLAAHGKPIESPTIALKKAREHRLFRESLLLAALKEAPNASLEDLLDRVYNDTPVWLWPLARLSLKAHLIKLERDGILSKNRAIGP